jgi:hypothetical protein
MDKLKAYKIDKAFTEGVEIRLPLAPEVVFLVRLPSEYNRAYTQALYGDAEFDIDEKGQVKMKGGLVDMKFRQEEAFAEHCLVSIDGEPVPDNFRRDYPEAVSELYLQANKLAIELDTKVGDSAKKSRTSSTGSSGGPERSDSTQSLSSVAS